MQFIEKKAKTEEIQDAAKERGEILRVQKMVSVPMEIRPKQISSPFLNLIPSGNHYRDQDFSIGEARPKASTLKITLFLPFSCPLQEPNQDTSSEWVKVLIRWRKEFDPGGVNFSLFPEAIAH